MSPETTTHFAAIIAQIENAEHLLNEHELAHLLLELRMDAARRLTLLWTGQLRKEGHETPNPQT